LKLVIVLTPETIDDSFHNFLVQNDVQISVLAQSIANLSDSDSFVEETVLTCLKLIANKNNLPALIICRTGRSATSVAIGCLRKIQKWSFYSIFEEYRRFSGGNLRLQHLNEQYIELFDVEGIDLGEDVPDFFTKYK
jgi:tyrosine-protein phosphatase SIW14